MTLAIQPAPRLTIPLVQQTSPPLTPSSSAPARTVLRLPSVSPRQDAPSAFLKPHPLPEAVFAPPNSRFPASSMTSARPSIPWPRARLFYVHCLLRNMDCNGSRRPSPLPIHLTTRQLNKVRLNKALLSKAVPRCSTIRSMTPLPISPAPLSKPSGLEACSPASPRIPSCHWRWQAPQLRPWFWPLPHTLPDGPLPAADLSNSPTPWCRIWNPSAAKSSPTAWLNRSTSSIPRLNLSLAKTSSSSST